MLQWVLDMKLNKISILFVAFYLVIVLGCPNLTESSQAYGKTVAFTDLEFGGLSPTETSAVLTLTFDADPTGLTASDIEITKATKGELSGSGKIRRLTISGIRALNSEKITVRLSNPPGLTIISPIRRVVVNRTRTPIVFTQLRANGGGTANIETTALTLTFSANPTTLRQDDITVRGATVDSFSGTGNTRTLGISGITVANGEEVTVSVANPDGFTITPQAKNVAVYVKPPPPTEIKFTGLSANGAAGVTTTELTLTFDTVPSSLAVGDITVSGATKGSLSVNGNTVTLAITDISVRNGEDITVTLRNPTGYRITPASKTVGVHVALTSISFDRLTANGTSGSVTTTQLTLTFSADPTTLGKDNITVRGATVDSFSGTGNTRTLGISGITVANGEEVTVSVTNPDGFAITPLSKNVAVHVAPTPITFDELTANGTSGSVPTTQLTLTFSADPTTLGKDNITTRGATADSFSGTGNTRTLGISSITVANGGEVTVSVTNPKGFAITPDARNVTVYRVAIAIDMTDVASGTFQRDATGANTSSVSAFRISATEITRAQFLHVMGEDPSEKGISGTMNDPVQKVNWYHAIAFCNKQSLFEGLTPVYTVSGINWNTLKFSEIPTASSVAWNAATVNWNATGYRLPTEMEWMWAAMGASDGSGTGYTKDFAGDTGGGVLSAYAWYAANSNNRTHSVKMKSANELDLFDMSGNVWEWIWDREGAYPSDSLSDYRGPVAGSHRIIRGGSYQSAANHCAVAARNYYAPHSQYSFVGFRVVLPPSSP